MDCPRCRGPVMEGANFCNHCGQPLAMGAPPPGPGPQAGHPLCRRCGSPRLLYFPNGRGICDACKHIFRWSPWGAGVMLQG